MILRWTTLGSLSIVETRQELLQNAAARQAGDDGLGLMLQRSVVIGSSDVWDALCQSPQGHSGVFISDSVGSHVSARPGRDRLFPGLVTSLPDACVGHNAYDQHWRFVAREQIRCDENWNQNITGCPTCSNERTRTTNTIPRGIVQPSHKTCTKRAIYFTKA